MWALAFLDGQVNLVAGYALSLLDDVALHGEGADERGVLDARMTTSILGD